MVAEQAFGPQHQVRADKIVPTATREVRRGRIRSPLAHRRSTLRLRTLTVKDGKKEAYASINLLGQDLVAGLSGSGPAGAKACLARPPIGCV